MKLSRKWKRIQPIYRYFGGEADNLDYSDEAAYEMYQFETYGKGNLGLGLFSQDRYNGYAIGKHWMDVTIRMWVEDIQQGTLIIGELYEWFPDWHWWLDKVIKGNKI